MRTHAERGKGPRLSYKRAERWAGGTRELADLCGLHVQTIYRWKRENYVPGFWRYWLVEKGAE